MRPIHFISGLPRSGSTMLGGILRQNPRCFASMSGPVGGVIMGALRAMGPDNEFSVFINDTQKRRILRSIVSGFYDEFPDAEILFDTNRLWCAHLPLIADLFPEAKIICCVRNPAWVMDSLERLHRENPLNVPRIFGSPADRATVFNRADAMLRGDRLIGFPLNALREAYYGHFADRLLLVEYDIMCQRPEQTIGLIYEFLGEPAFGHDFSHVEYEAEVFDRLVDTPGLHKVSGPVQFRPRDTCLPPEVFDRLAALDFWRRDGKTQAFRITGKTGNAAAEDRTLPN